MKSHDKAVSIHYITRLLDYMHEKAQVDTVSLLQEADIPAAWLDAKNSYISQEQYVFLINALLQTTDRQRAITDLLKNSEVTHHGLLGLLSMCGLTFKTSMAALLKFYRIQVKLIQLDFTEDNDALTLSLRPVGDLGVAEKFTIEMGLLAFQKAKRQLLGYVQKDDSLLLSYDIEHPSLYADAFHLNQVKCQQPYNQLVFPVTHRDMSIRSGHKTSFTMLYQQCEVILLDCANEKDPVLKVQLILKEVQESFPKLDDVAQLLSMSTRTLTRKLKQQNTSYQYLLDKEKISRAKALLSYTNASITEIAFGLHFSDASHFSKAFQRIEKITPTEYRQKQLS